MASESNFFKTKLQNRQPQMPSSDIEFIILLRGIAQQEKHTRTHTHMSAARAPEKYDGVQEVDDDVHDGDEHDAGDGEHLGHEVADHTLGVALPANCWEDIASPELSVHFGFEVLRCSPKNYFQAKHII